MSSPKDETQNKFDTINRMLNEEFVFIHIDPNCPKVTIPDHLKSQPTVTLKLSRLFRGGIEVSLDGIISNLLFNDAYFACFIPFQAIWGAISEKEEKAFWPDSVPKSVKINFIAEAEKTENSKKETPKRPALRRVK